MDGSLADSYKKVSEFVRSGPKAAADQVINRVQIFARTGVFFGARFTLSQPSILTHVQYTQTDTIRQTDGPFFGASGTIGTNEKRCHSNGSIGEYASH